MCPCHRRSVPLMRTVLRMLIRGSIHEALHKRVGPAGVWMVREGWVSPFILAASSRRGSLETLRLRHDAVSGRQSVYSALKVTYEPSHLLCYFCLTTTDLWYWCFTSTATRPSHCHIFLVLMHESNYLKKIFHVHSQYLLAPAAMLYAPINPCSI